MPVKSAVFLMSNTDVKKCPAPDLPEYAFIGRSNVGKSSLINMLTNQKNLAKTSTTPGKTQLINHFLIDEKWYLVDLPGYGFAKVSKEHRKNWEKFIQNYILKRENLVCLFVLIDIRHTPQKNDIEFMKWLGNNQVPFVIAFTKADKIPSSRREKNINAYKQEMLKYWESLPRTFVTSATKKDGKDEILSFVEETNASVKLK